MPELNQAAPCALCLQVDESESMLEVGIEATGSNEGRRIHLCDRCIQAIVMSMAGNDRFGQAFSTKGPGFEADDVSGGDDRGEGDAPSRSSGASNTTKRSKREAAEDRA